MHRAATLGTISLCITLTRTLSAQQAPVATRQVNIPDEPTCVRCTITSRLLTTLVRNSGEGSIDRHPNTVRVDSRGRYWVLISNEVPRVFDSTGQFLKTVGTKGRGPGEFIEPMELAMIGGDSILLQDGRESRATVISPSLVPVRSISTPWSYGRTMIFRWPDVAIANGTVPVPDRSDPPLHRVSFAQSPAAILGSFGPGRGNSRPGQNPSGWQQLSTPRGGMIWTADGARYRLYHWKQDGTLLRVIERAPPWYHAPSELWLGNPTTPPPPQTAAIEEDDSGLLWVFVHVAAPTWAEAWPKLAPGTREVSSSAIAYDKLFRTTVEVIDPTIGRVVARREFDKYILAALASRRAVTYSVDADGLPRLEVLSLFLSPK